MFEEDVIKELSAIEWWSSFQKSKGILTSEEKDIIILHNYLSAVASSAGIEKIFSTYGFVHSDVRNNLGNDKAGKLVFFFFFYKEMNK